MGEERSYALMRLFSDVSASIADPYLRRAWLLAELARGHTSPNPLVGCVLVRDGVVVGEGWHARAGEPHAEVMALRVAGERAEGSTAYVTLEPCAHTGRTGPCSSALVDAGVAAVVIGMHDPNPHVVGGGAAVLRDSGVSVRFADDPAPFEVQNEAWLHWLRTGRPFVQAKVALTLDGHPAWREGECTEITGTAAKSVTMRLRRAADAVVVGAGTVRVDDPALTVRDASGMPVERQPLRVVLAGAEPLPQASMFSDGDGDVLVLAQGEAGVVTATTATEPYDGTVDDALAVLGARDIVRVLVEPGPRLLTSLVREQALDELVIYHGGCFAGMRAPAAFTDPLDTGILGSFRLQECGPAGDDAISVWRPRASNDPEGA